MKKIHKKLLITATIFTAALNMNGCAYGPPQEEDMYSANTQMIEMQNQLEVEMQDTGSEENNA